MWTQTILEISHAKSRNVGWYLQVLLWCQCFSECTHMLSIKLLPDLEKGVFLSLKQQRTLCFGNAHLTNCYFPSAAGAEDISRIADASLFFPLVHDSLVFVLCIKIFIAIV